MQIFEEKNAIFPGKDSEISSNYPAFSKLLKSHGVTWNYVEPTFFFTPESELIILKTVSNSPKFLFFSRKNATQCNKKELTSKKVMELTFAFV